MVNTATANGTDALSRTVTAQASTSVDILRGSARIKVQIDTATGASIYIWDDTENQWAKDEATQNPIDGTYHTTPDNIAVAAGHCYTVWVTKEGYTFKVKSYPKGWSVTPEGGKAYGCLGEASVSIHFSAIM